MDSLNTDDHTGGLDLSLGPRLGGVIRMDMNRVEVELSDAAAASQVTVADLVAVPVGPGFLIGLVEGMLRHAGRRSDDAGMSAEPGGQFVGLRIMLLGTLHRGRGSSQGSFARGATGYPPLGQSCHMIDGERLRAFLSVVAAGVPEGERLILGRYVADREAPAIADGNRLFQRHVALLGSTGAGKSWAVALMLEHASRLRHANLIVFDLHGEYAPLVEAMNGTEPVARRLRIAGPGDVGDESEDLLYLPYWLLDQDEFLALVLNTGDPHAPDQILRLTEHVRLLKGVHLVNVDRENAVPRFTVDSPIPYVIEHLIARLRQDNEEKIPRPPSHIWDPGPYHGRLTGLISRIEARITDPRYGFIFTPPQRTLSYEWLTTAAAKLLGAGEAGVGIKVVDLSEVPSPVLPVVVGVLARLIYDVQFWMEPDVRTPVCLVCDEAHLYLASERQVDPVHAVSLQAFEAIAKEGRKYGVALLVVSQRPSDVSGTILSQCNNFIVMRLTDDRDQSMVERLVPEALTRITDILPALEVGEAILIGDALLLPTRFKFDMPAAKPTGATQPFWSLWSSKPSSEGAIQAGVEAFRNQLRAHARPPA